MCRFLNKLGTDLPYDPATPLLGIYPEKTIYENDTDTPVFTAVLYTIAWVWKQPRKKSINRGMDKDVVHLYNGILVIKKNKLESVLVRFVNREHINTE